jgi:hypothetical protein
MAVLKVLAAALLGGAFFAVAGGFLLLGMERATGSATPVVILGVACVGILLGAIAGAAQAVVDAILARK